MVCFNRSSFTLTRDNYKTFLDQFEKYYPPILTFKLCDTSVETEDESTERDTKKQRTEPTEFPNRREVLEGYLKSRFEGDNDLEGIDLEFTFSGALIFAHLMPDFSPKSLDDDYPKCVYDAADSVSFLIETEGTCRVGNKIIKFPSPISFKDIETVLILANSSLETTQSISKVYYVPSLDLACFIAMDKTFTVTTERVYWGGYWDFDIEDGFSSYHQDQEYPEELQVDFEEWVKRGKTGPVLTIHQ